MLPTRAIFELKVSKCVCGRIAPDPLGEPTEFPKPSRWFSGGLFAAGRKGEVREGGKGNERMGK